MPLFEKQPVRPAATLAAASEVFVVIVILLILVAMLTAMVKGHASTITIPPPPSNYAVLATDGKGHLFWLEPVNSPFPGGKQPMDEPKP